MFVCRGEKPHQKFSATSKRCEMRVLPQRGRTKRGAVTDKFGCFHGVNLPYPPSSGPPWFQQLLNFGGYCSGVPSSRISVWMSHFLQHPSPEQDDAPSPQAACAHPKLEKCWLWPFIERFWAGLDVREGQGKWWETSQPLMLVGVLGSSWDDAFVEETPSSRRDAPVKGQPLRRV